MGMEGDPKPYEQPAINQPKAGSQRLSENGSGILKTDPGAGVAPDK